MILDSVQLAYSETFFIFLKTYSKKKIKIKKVGKKGNKNNEWILILSPMTLKEWSIMLCTYLKTDIALIRFTAVPSLP